jgi:hypothetical protein
MWKSISDKMNQASTGLVAIIATIIFLLFMVFVLPGQSASAQTAGNHAGSPDTSFFYTPNDLYRMAEAYGPEGRQEYVRVRFTFDLVFPLVYTLFLAAAISWTFSKAFPAGSRMRLANLVPVLGMLFDYMENLSTSLVMLRYPAHTAVVDLLAPFFTMVKWIFVSGSFVVLLVGVVLAALFMLREKRSH